MTADSLVDYLAVHLVEYLVPQWVENLAARMDMRMVATMVEHLG